MVKDDVTMRWSRVSTKRKESAKIQLRQIIHPSSPGKALASGIPELRPVHRERIESTSIATQTVSHLLVIVLNNNSNSTANTCLCLPEVIFMDCREHFPF